MISTDPPVALCTGYYLPVSQTEAIFNSFYYDAKKKHAMVLQFTVSQKHSMKEKGLDRLKKLGVKKICYVAVTGPQNVFDLPVPLKYSDSEFLQEKYHLALNSL